MEEEQSVYNRSANKSIYLNVAVNTIKRLRNLILEKSPPSDKPFKSNLFTMSHQDVLGGSAAKKCTFTINRSGKEHQTKTAVYSGKPNIGFILFWEFTNTKFHSETQHLLNIQSWLILTFACACHFCLITRLVKFNNNWTFLETSAVNNNYFYARAEGERACCFCTIRHQQFV